MEKHSDNEVVKGNIYLYVWHKQEFSKCAKIIKETMEEKYGGMGNWQVK